MAHSLQQKEMCNILLDVSYSAHNYYWG